MVTLSFEPKETAQQAAAAKKAYLERYGRPQAAAGWHFLTGDAAAVAAVTRAVGFRYAWDEETRQYAHPTGVVVATPEGRIARYLYGVEYAPKDLRFALVEASGSVRDLDPKPNRSPPSAYTVGERGCTSLQLGHLVVIVNETILIPLGQVREMELAAGRLFVGEPPPSLLPAAARATAAGTPAPPSR